jgi:hypothetical protein
LVLKGKRVFHVEREKEESIPLGAMGRQEAEPNKHILWQQQGQDVQKW